MTTIKARLSSFELETRYEAAADPVGKNHFHALWREAPTPSARR